MAATPTTRPATAYLLANQPVAERRRLVCAVLIVLLLITFVLSAAHGPANIPYGNTAKLLLRGIGLPVGLDLPESDFTIINTIRLPRVLIGALVGAALACAGATMQGVFRNALADPGLLGITAGGGFVAVLVITTGLASTSLFMLPGAAFVGSLAACFLVYTLSMTRGRSDITALILAGMAISSLLSALTTTVILFTKEYAAVQAALSWIFGGLQGRGWDHLRVATVPVIAAIVVTFAYSRDLNILLTGEESAQTLGINVPRTRLILLALASLMTGAAVSIAGGIGFIGLMVPHMLRLIVGPDHRVLLPASALGGAVFLTLADTVARLILQPMELQVGVLTALIGAPFFLFLLWRHRQSAKL
ncbi:MAG: iron ABC transporter permease [Anaerolineae bacterium]|nr:iron ABC transporter permease [Anaerolineae bacterium]